MKKASSVHRILTPEQLERIDQISKEMLEKIGTDVFSEKAKSIFKKNGCKVTGDRVRIPFKLLDEITKYKQKELTLFSRSGESISLRPGWTHYHNSGTVSKIYDSSACRMRNADKKDVEQLTLLLDAMKNVDAVTPIVYPQDIDQNVSLLFSIKETFKNTIKPIDGPGVNNLTEATYIAEMASVFKQERNNHNIVLKISPISPMKISDGGADALIHLVEHGFPVGVLPCPIVGMTAPMSLLGAITQTNAEVLSILTLIRLIDNEAIVTYGGRLVVPNMVEMNTLGGSPESALVDVCAVQLAHHYNMISDIYGLGTSAVVPDVQIGYEKGIKGILANLSGSMFQSGVGSVNDAIAVSYEQIVIDNEIIENNGHALMGLSEDEETLGFNAVNDIMENGYSDFLSHPSTMEYMRSPEIFKIQNSIGFYNNWNKLSSLSASGIVENAREVAANLIKEHKVEPVSLDAQKELEAIYKKACDQLV